MASTHQRTIFHDRTVNTATIVSATTVVGATGSLAIGGRKTLVVDIAGTDVTPTTFFYGKGVSTTPHTLLGTRLDNGVTYTSSTATGQLWRFDVSGLTTFQATTSPVSPGNVVIYGKIIP